MSNWILPEERTQKKKPIKGNSDHGQSLFWHDIKTACSRLNLNINIQLQLELVALAVFLFLIYGKSIVKVMEAKPNLLCDN